MQLNQIDYFLEVADKLNFTAAAKGLYLSQPALSKQIALLEEELDTKLFVRSSRKVALTPAGEIFKNDLLRIRKELDAAKTKVMELGKKIPEVFRIACFDGAYVNDFLPRVYSTMKEILPNTEISLFRGDFASNKKALEQDAVDMVLGLDTMELKNDSLQSEVLCTREGAIIYSIHSEAGKKENPTIKDFENMTYFTLKEEISPDLAKRGLRELKKCGIEHPKIELYDHFMTLITNIIIGRGYSILSVDVAEQNEEIRAFKCDKILSINVIAVWKKSHPLAELLKDSFGENK